MRPLCQSTPRAPKEKTAEPTEEPEQGPPTIVINGGSEGTSTPRKPMSRSSTTREDSNDIFRTPSRDGKDHGKGAQKEKTRKVSHSKGSKSPKIGTSTPSSNQKEPRKQSYHPDKRTHSPSSSTSRRDLTHPKGNIFTFMPYLHFESTRRRQEMQQAIKRAEILRSPPCPYLGKASTYDEMLIRAHLATSTASLHVRRTLDQSFYHNIDTESRDEDQVVYRYQLKDRAKEEVDPKIVMVDQLWMWILGPNLIVTSFPQRWQQPKNDPLNVLDNVIEDINSKTREPVQSVYDLAMTITSRCTGVFDRHRMGDEEYQFLDMFESSIGSATDRETVLFKEFNTASAQASAWLQHHRRPNRFSRYLSGREKEAALALENSERTKYLSTMGGAATSLEMELARAPLFVDKLLDIGLETDLLAETKDIRDELNMITKILSEQASVLPSLSECITSHFLSLSPPASSQSIRRSIAAQLKTIEQHLQDLARMDRQAKRIYESITDMLDLKQKHANAFEARFARDQAAGTMRQGQTIMVFTIVTIVFLPLSFIAAFFAINVREFPRAADGQGTSLPLRWVAKYMFGIGLAVSIPLILIALSLDDIADLFKHIKIWWGRRTLRREAKLLEGSEGVDSESLNVLKLQQALSRARSGRKSVETEWIRERLSTSRRPDTSGTREGERLGVGGTISTGFRIRGSMDVERGLAPR